ncbi:hypothetical protein D9758_013224 [Tetrapyrgos nigripes]|uniref:Uncharacterized protein n=1 Tax=Tetrapyrgos nigripes TaxID=182062 RepID=A0A8H5CRP2_9AGAR|nr:hypothetical protein D9758_013224 [Tetrapyrgos nigripes]
MKFITAATVISALFVGALAQNPFAHIVLPTEGASLKAGTNVSVDVARALFVSLVSEFWRSVAEMFFLLLRSSFFVCLLSTVRFPSTAHCHTVVLVPTHPSQDPQGNVIVESEIGISLGLASCPNDPSDCLDPSESMGTFLYGGDFYPVFGDGPEPNVNITVEIPANTPKGEARLNLGHFFLLGQEFKPQMETSSVKVTIV